MGYFTFKPQYRWDPAGNVEASCCVSPLYSLESVCLTFNLVWLDLLERESLGLCAFAVSSTEVKILRQAFYMGAKDLSGCTV